MQIELIIKIPEEIRIALINNIQLSLDQQSICDSCIKQAIINGIRLPKGHGRLIDADELLKQSYRINDSMTLSTRDVVNEEEINDALTIIEAESEE